MCMIKQGDLCVCSTTCGLTEGLAGGGDGWVSCITPLMFQPGLKLLLG